jgi:WD40 repeat protein
MDPKELKARFEPKQTKVIEADPQVLGARFTPCGKYLVAGTFDGRVRRWHVGDDSLPELEALTGHNGWVQAVATSAESSWLFSADTWGQVRGWCYADEKPEPKWSVPEAHGGWIRALAASPDGKALASCGADRKLRLWSAADGKPIRDLVENGEDLYTLAWHPDGQSIFCGDAKGIVKHWDLASEKCLREFNAGVLFKLDRLQDVGGARCMALDQQAKRLAVGGTKVGNGGSVTGIPTLLVFEVASGELKETRELGSTNDVYVCDVAWHKEGFLMAVTSGQPGAGKLLFLRPEDKDPFVSNTSMANCHTLSVHPDGLRLAVVATNRGSNGNGRPKGEYKGNKSPIHLFALPAAPA